MRCRSRSAQPGWRAGCAASGSGRLIDPVDDDLAPGQAIARIAIRNSAAAAKPATIKIGTGPVDAHRQAIREFLDVAGPRQSLTALIERFVERKADEIRRRRLQHGGTELFVQR